MDLAMAKKLAELRGRLDAWIKETGDKGHKPEDPAMFESDMALYLNAVEKKKDPVRLDRLKANIKLMKDWQAAGK